MALPRMSGSTDRVSQPPVLAVSSLAIANTLGCTGQIGKLRTSWRPDCFQSGCPCRHPIEKSQFLPDRNVTSDGA